jgi:hypothetical protein
MVQFVRVSGCMGLSVAVAVLAGGCTGGDKVAGSMSTSPPIPAAGPSSFNSTVAGGVDSATVPPEGKSSGDVPENAETVAQAAGCKDVRAASVAEASDAVHCFMGAASVDVVSFPTAAERDTFAAESSARADDTVRIGQSGSAFWAAVATGGTSSDLQPFGGSAAAAHAVPTVS